LGKEAQLMHSPTAITTTRWTPAPTARRESDASLAALMQRRMEAAEWLLVRRGIGLMAWSLIAFLICVLGFILACRRSAVAPFAFLFLAGLLLSGAGYMVGVVLSLLAPRRARLGGWISIYIAGLVAGVFLLVLAGFWREMMWQITAFTWRGAPRAVALSGVVAVLVGLLAYCLYLAGIARRFGARYLAGGFVVFFGWLALVAGLIGLAEDAVYRQPSWIYSAGGDWKRDLFLFAAVLLFALGLVWPALLWRLRRRLPREETHGAADEE
jgi:hypothetical protein